MARRHAGHLAAAWLVVLATAAGASEGDAATAARRTQLVEEGEAKLAAGDAAAARQAFEAASQIVHAADVELGLVRSDMQAGEYRRALSFSAHAAGAHGELPGGMALHAWLLSLGGQQAVAMRMLDEAIGRAPTDAVLLQARAQLSSATPRAAGVLAQPPWRLAPYDGSGRIGAGASVTGSGVLGADGRSALVPAAALSGARQVWVRNGMGQAARAVVAERLADVGLVRLELADALPGPERVEASLTAPFAGSPSYMVEFVASRTAEPAWPILRQGFFGRRSDALLPMPLGIDAPRSPRGGPVFDRAGRLVGVAVSAADGIDRMVPLASIAQRLPAFRAGAELASSSGSFAVDALYESALRLTLQVVVAP